MISDASELSELADKARAIDDQLAAIDLSGSAHARISERLAGEGARYGDGRLSTRTWSGLAFAGGLAAAAAVLLAAPIDWREALSVESNALVHVDGFELLSGACAVERDGDAVEVGRDCRLRLGDLGVDMRVLSDATIVAREHGVEVRDGWVVFDVESVPAGGAPVSVDVPAGRIDVLGTQFVVTVGGRRGHVELVEGSIAFADLAGHVSVIEPGQRVAWSATQVESGAAWVALVDPPPDFHVTGAPSEPVAVATQRSERDHTSDADKPTKLGRSSRRKLADEAALDQALEDVHQLRAVRRYRAALRKLERIRQQVRDPKVQEVLAYEAGTLLESSGERQNACKHWRQHNRKYPDGSYRENVDHRLLQLGCE